MARQKVVLQAENFEVTREKAEDTDKEEVIIEGVALPFGQPSRNGVQYTKESVKQVADKFEGRPMLFNHKEDFVSGHVIETAVTEDAMFFKGNLNPNAEMPNGVTIAEAAERGDINSVSIQAFVEPLGESADEDAVVEDMETEKVDVVDPLEISPVSIPGFENTSAMPEHLQGKNVMPVTEAVGREDHDDDEDAKDKEELIELAKEQDFECPFPFEDHSECVSELEDEEDIDDADALCAEWVRECKGVEPGEEEKKKEQFDDYPEAAQENARMALEAREETGNPNDCGTRVGWERANQLDNGENLSADTVGRMAAFERHEDNKEQGEEGRADCGWMMWNAWGGDEGIEWAQNKLDEIEEEDLSEEVIEILQENDIMSDNEQGSGSGQDNQQTETEGDVAGEDILEFAASHFDGMDVADFTGPVDDQDGEYVGQLDLREAAALVADRVDEDPGTVLESWEQFMDEEGMDEDDEEDEEEAGDKDMDDDEEEEEMSDNEQVEKLEEKIETLEKRIETILDEDPAESKQDNPSKTESTLERRPSFKDALNN